MRKNPFSFRSIAGHAGRLFVWMTLSAAAISASAATVYWDGVTGDWSDVANWSTASGATTPNPAAVPTGGDTAIFNITIANNDQTVYLNGSRGSTSSRIALQFDNTGTTQFLGGTSATAANNTLYTTDITVNAGAGAVTIGDTAGTPTRSVDIQTGTHTFTNNSSNLFTIANGIRSVGSSGTTTMTFSGTGNTSILGQVNNGTSTNVVALTKSGSGTLALAGSNGYTGATTISAGKLQIGNGGTTGSLSSSSAITNNANLTINRSDITLGSTISGSGSFTQAGSGTTQLSGALTYTGVTTISAGVLRINSGANTLYANTSGFSMDGGSLVVFAGSTRTIATPFTFNSASGNITTFDNTPSTSGHTLSGTMTVNSGATMAIRPRNVGLVNFIVTGKITGAGNFEVANGSNDADTAAVRVSNATNDYLGNTTITGGILQLGASGVIPNTSTITMNLAVTRKPTLDLNGHNETINGLVSTATTAEIFNNSGTGQSVLSVGANNASASFAGIIMDHGATAGGTVALTKLGSGMQTLTGVNTYTGTTTVGAGTLAITGSIAGGAVSVQSGATLGGSGSIGGATSILGGGILAPGTSPGTLTITNTLTLADTSILAYELDAANQTVGGGINDLVTGVTDLTLGGVLNVTGIGDFSTVPQGAIWRLINYSGSLSGNGLTIGSAPSLAAGLSFEVDTGTAGQVNLVVVPEPATLVGLIAGGLAIAAARRYRKRT